MSGMEQDGPDGRDRQDRQDRPGGTDSGSGAAGEPEDTPFEARLRDLLERETDGFRPGEAPYASIVRQGRNDRRRRLAVAGAGLAALVAVPSTAVAVHFQLEGGGATGQPAAGTVPAKSAGTVRPQSSAPAVRASRTPSGPAGPATPGQLVDGITMRQAAEGLDKCLRFDRKHAFPGDSLSWAAEDYRVILALRATGDDNSPGDGFSVVAVDRLHSTSQRLICDIRDGQASGINSGADDDPGRGAVAPDINATKLYQQTVLPGHAWRLPYRWGSIGTVEPQVARVTVSYGGVTEEAALDHGYYTATGILTESVTSAPRVKGYNAAGTLVYDSRQDTAYQQKVSG
ncbi:hypothetical protein ACIP9H_08800 [Streptomyces sp. NPDC088732]|uniref:hypothetical protein n=1 Tax=Streptomyces sp. NPDC088732 TaxID=3365879 RepID=UPI003808A3CE